jgi:3-oxoadipyl-CoA thiolase
MTMGREAWIIEAVRTPIGRYGGTLSGVRPDDLGGQIVAAAVTRAAIDRAAIDDVILGCANQAGEDNRNVARMAALLADLPVTVPGQTINRLCGSGLQAVNSAAHAILAGEGDLFVAGGVESMSRAPFIMMKAEEAFPRGAPKVEDSVLGWRFVNRRFPDEYTISLGRTAEVVAADYGITRLEQDEFAAESQRRAAAAMETGAFTAEIVGVPIAGPKGQTSMFERDEHPRPDSTVEKLARLRPAFKENGTVTAGNSSGLNDGAAALVVVSSDRAGQEGLKPMAKVMATAVAGVEPHRMGLGPIPATRLALKRAGMQIGDIDLVELNEAFAAQSLPCIRELNLDPSIVNVNGGAIALGHPLGCSGARILTTLVHALRQRGGGVGLATMCIGVGQGIATVVEVFG